MRIGSSSTARHTVLPCPARESIANRLVHGLLEAHETVLAAARSGASGHECADTATSRDFAARQVVLVNDMQLQSISYQLIARSDRRRVLITRQDGPDAHGKVSG